MTGSLLTMVRTAIASTITACRCTPTNRADEGGERNAGASLAVRSESKGLGVGTAGAEATAERDRHEQVDEQQVGWKARWRTWRSSTPSTTITGTGAAGKIYRELMRMA